MRRYKPFNTSTIFWNVDTQYDFMRDDEEFKGALAIPGAKAIEKNLERLTSITEYYFTVNTADWHTSSSKEFSPFPDYKTTFPPHCLIGTKGAEFIPATRPVVIFPYIIDWRQKDFSEEEFLDPSKQSKNVILYKDAFDVFEGSPHTKKLLEILEPKEAIVYGVAADVCVNYAVNGLLKEGIKVYVVEDAIKELPNTSFEDLFNLFDSWEQKGAVLTKTDDVIVKYCPYMH